MTMIPFGRRTGNPGLSSKNVKSSSFCPRVRWSRASASVRSFRVLFQGGAGREADPADALERPVRLGFFRSDRREAKHVDPFEPTRVRNVRPAAEVDERPGVVDRDRFSRRSIGDVPELVGVGREQPFRLLPGHLTAPERLAGLYRGPDRASDGVEVRRSEGTDVEVVVEPVSRWGDRR